MNFSEQIFAKCPSGEQEARCPGRFSEERFLKRGRRYFLDSLGRETEPFWFRYEELYRNSKQEKEKARRSQAQNVGPWEEHVTEYEVVLCKGSTGDRLKFGGDQR